MQRQKKIQKSRDLKDGARARSDEAHLKRFETILEGARQLASAEEGGVDILMNGNGSCRVSSQLEIVRGALERRARVVIRGGSRAAEKVCKLVELAKEQLGVSPQRIFGKIDGGGQLVFTIE